MANFPPSNDVTLYDNAMLSSEYQRAVQEAVAAKKRGDATMYGAWHDYAARVGAVQTQRTNDPSIIQSVRFGVANLQSMIAQAAAGLVDTHLPMINAFTVAVGAGKIAANVTGAGVEKVAVAAAKNLAQSLLRNPAALIITGGALLYLAHRFGRKRGRAD